MSAHNHSHVNQQHAPQRVNRRPLVIALAITSTFLVVEVIGALVTNSLALLADAGHMLTDVAALALSLFAIWIARRPVTLTRSFGYLRAEVLAAAVNAASLVIISMYILWEAYQRLGDPPEVDSGPMLAVAFAGLLANAASAWVLMRGGGHQESLNVRGAFLHVVGDMLGSVGAIAAALIMLATGWYLADPILSAGIGALILFSAWRLLKESVDVLLEAAPRQIDPTAMKARMIDIDGVEDVHDLHVWTVTSGLVSMSSHVEVSAARDWHEVLLEMSTRLREEFGIAHVTLQPEESARLPDSFRGCSLDSPEGIAACQIQLSNGVNRNPAHGGHRH